MLEKDFGVTKVMDGSQGSYIAMAFNEFGQTILSREGEGLLLVDFTMPVENSGRTRILNEDVKNVQGILPLNGMLFVTGQGPAGLGIYRLEDANRDGFYEQTTKVLSFSGRLGEHGPHALRLGSDGMVYCLIGNANQAAAQPAWNQPLSPSL